jgi:hypothetical protein
MRVKMTDPTGKIEMFDSLADLKKQSNRTINKLTKQGYKIERLYATGYWEEQGVPLDYLKTIAWSKSRKYQIADV